MATATKRKTNTMMVYNPSRGLSIGGRSTVRKSASRRNPTAAARKVVNPHHRKRVHHRRRHNPSTSTGLVMAAVMAALGVSLFDLVTSKVVPATAGLPIRIGVKLGGAFLFQSSLGSKIPVIGKHKNDIALVLGVSAFIDIFKGYIWPLASQSLTGLTGSALRLVNPPQQADDSSMGNIYGNANVAYSQAGW